MPRAGRAPALRSKLRRPSSALRKRRKALNRLSYIADPLGRNAYYAYDTNSNLRKTRDNNGLNTYFVYDALDRRTQIRYSGEGYGVQAYGTSAYGAPVQYFAYDGMSNLTKVLDAWGASYFVYDALNRVSKRTTPRGDALYYAYDGVSNLTKLRYPQGTAACYYVYDAANRMTTLDSPVGKRAYFVYDADSNVAKKRLGNGMSVYFAYDNADRVAAIRYLKSTGGGMTYFAYNRDVSGRINKLARETDLAVYYAYDSVDRVTAETWRKKSDYSQIYAFSYVYDAAGNRTRMRREAAAGVETESVYYTYNGDNSTRKRRKQIPPATFETAYYVYNLNGSRTREIIGADTTYYEYGPHGFMTAILPPAATATRFYYDGQLNRYKVDLAGTPTYFLWNGLNEIEERNADGTLAARQTHGYAMIPGIGSAEGVQRTTSTTTYYQYPLMDHRGTVYAVADAGQNKQIEYVQDAFGRQLATPGGSNPTVPNDLQYQTNWRTLTVGGKRLCVSPSRIYVPDDGVFLERDPLPSAAKAVSNMKGNTSGIWAKTRFLMAIAEAGFKPSRYSSVGSSGINLPVSINSSSYNYSDATPVRLIDPFGLKDCCAEYDLIFALYGPIKDVLKMTALALNFDSDPSSAKLNPLVKGIDSISTSGQAFLVAYLHGLIWCNKIIWAESYVFAYVSDVGIDVTGVPEDQKTDAMKGKKTGKMDWGWLGAKSAWKRDPQGPKPAVRDLGLERQLVNMTACTDVGLQGLIAAFNATLARLNPAVTVHLSGKLTEIPCKCKEECPYPPPESGVGVYGGGSNVNWDY